MIVLRSSCVEESWGVNMEAKDYWLGSATDDVEMRILVTPFHCFHSFPCAVHFETDLAFPFSWEWYRLWLFLPMIQLSTCLWCPWDTAWQTFTREVRENVVKYIGIVANEKGHGKLPWIWNISAHAVNTGFLRFLKFQCVAEHWKILRSHQKASKEAL